MQKADKQKKNSLAIRLTESAVFLRTSETAGRRRNHDSQSSMLRGLLTLDLVKPTKITSIEIELHAKVSTSWPEGTLEHWLYNITLHLLKIIGIGARRIDITEEHRLFSASTVFFRAGGAPRRTASIGPGVHCSNEDMEAEEWQDIRSHSSTPRYQEDAAFLRATDFDDRSLSRPAHPASRRLSADSSVFQRDHVSQREEFFSAPIPPYSPGITTPNSSSSEHIMSSPGPSSSHWARVHEDPAQTLEDFRNALRAGLTVDHRSQYLEISLFYRLTV